MQSFSFLDMQTLKARAKACKETHPHLSQAQRLNLVAKRDYGFDNFHQVKKLREKEVMRHVQVADARGGNSKCKFCELEFVLPYDRSIHLKRHENLEEAIHFMRYEPIGYHRREDMKASCWKQTHSAPTLEGRAKGYLGVFHAWFDRSVFGLMCDGRWRKHPDFPTYVSMILSATELPEDVFEYLVGLYGLRKGHIPEGQSYWQES